MKHITIFLLAVFAAVQLRAQTYKAQVSQDPAQPWLITITHNDWGFFDPGYDALKVYVFINTSHNSDGQNLWDTWGTFITELTWNEAVGARQGTFNIKDYVFNGSNNSLNNGNTLNNFGFILVRVPENGSWQQTDDIFAAEYGFTPFTIPTLAASAAEAKTQPKVYGGKLFTPEKGPLELNLYDFSGKLIKSRKTVGSGNPIDLEITSSGLYILTVKSSSGTTSVKFSN